MAAARERVAAFRVEDDDAVVVDAVSGLTVRDVRYLAQRWRKQPLAQKLSAGRLF